MEQKYLNIKEAAVLLGVSPLTLRNWDKRGQLVAYRHPVNNYRVYKREDIDKIINQIESGPVRPKRLHINFIEDSPEEETSQNISNIT